MPHDVFEHHDRVVDHEADGKRQPQKRDIVDTVAEQVHGPKRGDQRQRHGKRRHDRRRNTPEEQIDHQHDQRDRQP
ncbi:hypothetical protein D3C87_1958750 [compost metagenome]